MQGVAVLGSTGSIGINTLDVLARHRDRYRVVALTARNQVDRLFEQCREWQPEVAVVEQPADAERLAARLREIGSATEVLSGLEGYKAAAGSVAADTVMAAIVGAAGLLPTLEAVRAGKRVLLANKEPLVMVGDLIMAEAARSGAVLLPIDSEHNAIFQCLPPKCGVGDVAARAMPTELGVSRILLTGSGGPFRTLETAALATVTPEQACAHPNWSMGKKISVDSATMMNKGLELIEACRLFRVHPDQVEIVIHPQSVIHSMVAYVDGSVLAQLGNPDMRTPIAHALAWPQRMESGVAPLDIFQVARLDFSPPDMARFPCLGLADQAARAGGTAPTLLNAANEVAVQAFLDEQLGFTHIPVVIEETLSRIPSGSSQALDAVLDADRRARAEAQRRVGKYAGRVRRARGKDGHKHAS